MNDKNNIITLAHGNGGKHSHQLIQEIFVKSFSNASLNEQLDSAVLDNLDGHQLAFTTDSFVVKPLFFPGGDIGKLAVTGTVNDLAVCGAVPKYLSTGMIIEEGFNLDLLKKIVQSMQETAKNAGVILVTGDTKVVEKGSVDGIFINTSGIGFLDSKFILNPARIEPGDHVLINGSIGDHGIAVLNARNEFPIQMNLESDCACLNGLIQEIMSAIDPEQIKVMRDPTRGGIATTLNEFTEHRSFGIQIDESLIPIKDQVKSLCEMTGFDPFYIANEGKMLIIAASQASEKIVKIMQRHPFGKEACKIGTVTEEPAGMVTLKTVIGGTRIIDMLAGNMLPRIC